MSKNNEATQETQQGRRAFLGQLAVGAAASAGVLSLSSVANAMVPTEPSSAELLPDAEHWLDGLKGKHRQLVDAYAANDAWPLGFTHTFLATQGPKETAGAVIVFRHFAMPIALQDSVWTKYKIGASLKITDPATKEPAARNPYLKPKAGVLLVDDMAIDRLLSRGVIVGACNVALTVLSGMFAANAGVSADQAKQEWTAGLLPGVTLLPSGVWGVNRAQEKGCTYVAGGG